MSKSTTNGYAGAYFQTNDAEVITTSIYGVRYPDGTIAWDSTQKVIEEAAKNENKKLHWQQRLREKAQDLHIDPEPYVAGHTIIRRTVIISATAPEEV